MFIEYSSIDEIPGPGDTRPGLILTKCGVINDK
jgi:hypothetical protein